MNALVYTEYGTPANLSVKSVPVPVPGKNEVRIRVVACGLNSWDWDLLRGRPYIVRMWGIRKPKLTILGADVSGVVEEAGENVRKFKPGDEVFGDLSQERWGGLAQFVCAGEKSLVLKPRQLSFTDAAAIPQAGVMAHQSIHDKGMVKKGDRVLLNGAGGGVGTFALQMAKAKGAEVTAVDHGSKLDRLRALGADHVIDYQNEDFTTPGKAYDLIVDVVADRPLKSYKRVLAKGGRYLLVGGKASPIIQAMVLGPLLSAVGSQKLGIMAHEPNKDLQMLGTMCENESLKPVIDKEYSLSKAPEAFRQLGEGKVFGKVIVKPWE